MANMGGSQNSPNLVISRANIAVVWLGLRREIYTPPHLDSRFNLADKPPMDALCELDDTE